jgi:hypothetical protein
MAIPFKKEEEKKRERKRILEGAYRRRKRRGRGGRPGGRREMGINEEKAHVKRVRQEEKDTRFSLFQERNGRSSQYMHHNHLHHIQAYYL